MLWTKHIPLSKNKEENIAKTEKITRISNKNARSTFVSILHNLTETQKCTHKKITQHNSKSDSIDQKAVCEIVTKHTFIFL